MDYRERIEAKVGILFQIANQYLSGQMQLEEAKKLLGGEMVSIRPAQLEATKTELGERLKTEDNPAKSEKLFELFRNYLPPPYHKLQAGHPLRNYYEENSMARSVLLTIDEMEGEEAARPDWKEKYELLSEFTVHIRRLEKNFYSLLVPMNMRLQVEKAKDLGKAIHNEISENLVRLENGETFDFLLHQRSLSRNLMNYLDLEERVLYAKALIKLKDRDFVNLRKSDDIEGYAFMEQPEEFIPSESRKHPAGLDDGNGQTEEAGTKRTNAGPDPGLILSALLEAKELGLEYYTLSGELVSVMGSEIAGPSRVMESIVRDRFGTARGILKIVEKITGQEETGGARKRDAGPKEVDPRQSIEELFRMYPKFREDFFHLDEELEGLKGPFGRDLLKDSTVEMIAKSLRIDTGSLTDRINELLKSYSCAE